MRNNRLPSIRGLRAFEATARHLSFTQAAGELNLTQGAVSHQIKNVEQLLGKQLFLRNGNELQLTDTGRDYLAAVRPILTQMITATNQAMDRERGDVLTIACLVTFANKCLFPNLGSFIDANPDIEIRVKTFFPGTSFGSQDYDLLIHYGSEADWNSAHIFRITTEALFPVCSPAYLEKVPELREPADLRHCRLIHSSSPLILRDDWVQWMKYAGVDEVASTGRITFDHLNPSYQAAIEGLGVALGRNVVIKRDLRAGTLVEPFDIRMPTTLGYFVLVPEDRQNQRPVRLFTDWVRDHLGPQLNG